MRNHFAGVRILMDREVADRMLDHPVVRVFDQSRGVANHPPQKTAMKMIIENLSCQRPSPSDTMGLKEVGLLFEAGFGNLPFWLVFQINLQTNELGAGAIPPLDKIRQGEASRIVFRDFRTRNSTICIVRC